MAAFSRAAWGLFVLRLTVGLVFFMHGVPKLTGGMEQTAQFFASLGIPAPVVAAWAVAVLEVVGGIGLMAGLLTPLWNLLFIAEMVTAIAVVHYPRGFYVIGPGQGGYEFSMLLIAANVCLLLVGAGAWAVTGRRGGRVTL
jgi:putative oxidoreductase